MIDAAGLRVFIISTNDAYRILAHIAAGDTGSLRYDIACFSAQLISEFLFNARRLFYYNARCKMRRRILLPPRATAIRYEVLASVIGAFLRHVHNVDQREWIECT